MSGSSNVPVARDAPLGLPHDPSGSGPRERPLLAAAESNSRGLRRAALSQKCSWRRPRLFAKQCGQVALAGAADLERDVGDAPALHAPTASWPA